METPIDKAAKARADLIALLCLSPSFQSLRTDNPGIPEHLLHQQAEAWVDANVEFRADGSMRRIAPAPAHR